MRSFLKIVFSFALCGLLAAEETIPLASFENIPDSSVLRKTIASTWLLAPPEDVAALKPTEYTDGTGKRFSVESYVRDDILEVRITPYDTSFAARSASHTETPAPDGAAVPDTTVQNDADDQPPALPETLIPTIEGDYIPQGTWILRRDAKTGEPLSITVYLRESSGIFLVLHPATQMNIRDKSLIDFCLFSAYVRRDFPINSSFDSLYYTSLVTLKKNTANILPWYVFDAPAEYSTVETTSKVVEKKLSSLIYIEDGAFDENGKPVYISTGKPQTSEDLKYAVAVAHADSSAAAIPAGTKIIGGVNGFGFVKWIIDGIIKPIAGSGTYIASLQLPTDVPNTNFTESYITKRNPFLGLDWIRNLAAARLSLTMKKTVYPYQAGIDVSVEPFSFSLPVQNGTEKGKKFLGYFKPSGYQIEYLKPLLYYLALTEPNNFYLVSVNQETGNPALRQYNHTAALFPYFDIMGTFHVDVYDNAAQITLHQFIENNAVSFVALVRIKSPEAGFFKP